MNPSGRKVCDVPGSGPAVVGTLTPVGSLRLAAGLVATQLLHHCWAEPQGSGPGVVALRQPLKALCPGRQLSLPLRAFPCACRGGASPWVVPMWEGELGHHTRAYVVRL